MNRGDIIRMATEAGILEPIELLESNQWRQDTIRELERFAAIVAAEKEKQIINILRRLQERNHSHNYYAYAINVIKGEA